MNYHVKLHNKMVWSSSQSLEGGGAYTFFKNAANFEQFLKMIFKRLNHTNVIIHRSTINFNIFTALKIFATCGK